MGNKAIFYKSKKHYTYQEIIAQISMLKKYYNSVDVIKHRNHRTIDVFIVLKPTEESLEYKVKLTVNVNSKVVNVYPVDPYIGLYINDNKVPHMYSDGSLCLFYPEYEEWHYKDWWSDTIIPWTCLWLYYYEAWLQTDEWLGGGIHGGKLKSIEIDS